LTSFADVFTKPTWKYAQTLLIGAIICRGKRTVSSILRAMGMCNEKRFERYHRVLNKAIWNEFRLVKILVGLIVALLPNGIEIYVAMDETLERRSGKKIKVKGCYRDACRSSHSLVIKCFGIKWLCAAMIVKLPWANRYWALPFMTVLCPSKKHDTEKNIKHNTSIDRAMQLVSIISNTLRRPWILLGDGGFACLKLANRCITNNVPLISRLRLDAALFELLSKQSVNKRGRKPIKGKKIKTLKASITDNEITWQEQKVSWYGGMLKNVLIATGINMWYKSGETPVMIRWVLVKNAETGIIEAFFSTNTNHSAVFIIESFILRWNIEVTFEEARAHLGVETQRQWSTKAIKRTTPILMGLFSIICIMANELRKNGNGMIKAISTAWYDKSDNITFSDTHTYVKQAITMGLYFNKSAQNDDFIKIPRQDFENLVNTLLMAA
jgi:hypothetical protein